MFCESIENKSADRDYNKKSKKREEHLEMLGGGISYCIRKNNVCWIIIGESNENN